MRQPQLAWKGILLDEDSVVFGSAIGTASFTGKDAALKVLLGHRDEHIANSST
jgi:hypothetical protein